ncbi:hypothetical protein SUGI_0297190 [Cryptomeria japonica]|nr:hypothetical protein SUGI_0297190 [Cryptomeria japonica]
MLTFVSRQRFAENNIHVRVKVLKGNYGESERWLTVALESARLNRAQRKNIQNSSISNRTASFSVRLSMRMDDFLPF